ncbi:MAG: autotransporter-associated beta strand repeat-containing protein [Acidobacteriota bacterium]|nr:autotransporter-associated beta strand repeat-containing protein [Acidobacteriota bacterium]
MIGTGGAGGGAGFGGAIFVANGGSLTLVNPGFSNNAVQGGVGGSNDTTGQGGNGAALAPDLFLNGVIPTIQVGSGLTLTLSNPICGAGNSLGANATLADANSGFIKTGAGTLTLAAANQFGGPVTVSAGTLITGAPAAFGPGTSAFTLASSATLDLNGYSLTAASLEGNGGTITNNGGGNVTLTLNNGPGNPFSGVITDHQTGNGTIALALTAGSLAFAGANTYSGGTTLANGTLAYADGNGAFGTGPLTINGATVLLSPVSILNPPSNLQVGALNGSAGVITAQYVGGERITVGNGGGSGSFGGTIQDTGPLFDRKTVGLTKVGGGTEVLTGSNSYGGGTQVSGGILQPKFPGSLPNFASVSVANGATLAVNVGGANEWVASNVDSLRGSASFSVGSSLGIDTTDGDFTYSSNIGGTLGLTKLGPNTTLTLTGTTSYTGPTLVVAGTLLFTNSASLGAVAVNPGATLMVIGGTFAASGGVNNSGTIRIEHGAVLSVPSGSSFVNSGLLDVITGSFTPPTGFVNNGIVLDSRVVKTKSFTRSGGIFSVVIDGYSGHTYQLQRGSSPANGSFTNLGAPQSGATGGVLTFNDASPDPTRGFYRVQVDP